MTTKNEIIYWKRVSNLVDIIGRIKNDEVYEKMWMDKLKELMLEKLPKMPSDENPLQPIIT